MSDGGDLRFRQEEGHPRLSLDGAWMNVSGLKVVDEDDNEPLIVIDRLEMADTTAEVDRREVILGKIELAKAHLVCRREKDDSLNLTRAFLPAPTTPDKTEAMAADQDVTPAKDPGSSTAVLNLKQLKVSDVSVDVEDRVPADPFRIKLDAIAITASDLSTVPQTAGKLDLSLRWEQGGEVRAGGDLTLVVPLVLNAAVKMKAMDIRPFQPYLPEQA